MDNEKPSWLRKTSNLLRRNCTPSSLSLGSLHVPKLRNTLQKENKPSRATNQRHLSVPSDLGPGGAIKHIQQNRQASGAPELPPRRYDVDSVSDFPRCASEGHCGALSRGLGSEQYPQSIATSPTSGQGKLDDPAPTEATIEISENNIPRMPVEHYRSTISQQTYQTEYQGRPEANVYPKQEVVPFCGPPRETATPKNRGPRTGSVLINAEAFELFPDSQGEIFLECAGVLTFPLHFQEHVATEVAIGFALVLDNSGFSSNDVCEQICAMVDALFSESIITKADYLTILLTQPNDQESAFVLKCGHHRPEVVQAALRDVVASTRRPVVEQLDITVARAMEELQGMWQQLGRPNDQFGHVLVLTANVNAVKVEFSPAAMSERMFPVYLLAANPVVWYQTKPPSSTTLDLIKAKVGPNLLKLNTIAEPSNPSEEYSDLKGLISQIRTASLPVPLKNVTVAIKMGRLDSADEEQEPEFQEILDKVKIGTIHPGEKVPFTLQADVRKILVANKRPLARRSQGWMYSAAQCELEFEKLGNSLGIDLYLHVEHNHPQQSTSHGKIIRQHKLGPLIRRDGEYNEPRAALFQSQALKLLGQNKLSTVKDLLPESPIVPYSRELRNKLRFLVNAHLHHHDSGRHGSYTSAEAHLRGVLQESPPPLLESKSTTSSDDTDVSELFNDLQEMRGEFPTRIGALQTPDSYRNAPRDAEVTPTLPLNVQGQRRQGRVWRRAPKVDKPKTVVAHEETDVTEDEADFPDRGARDI